MIDKQLVLSDAQVITTTADSEVTLNFGVANPNIGEGTPLILHVEVAETLDASGAGNLTVELVHGASSSPADPTGIKTGAIGKATLVKGYKILEVALPFAIKQYMELVYTVGTGPMTAGKIDAWIEPKC